MRQNSNCLSSLRRKTAARINQMTIAFTLKFEIALVVSGCSDCLAVSQFQRCNWPRFSRMLDAHAPCTIAMLTERQYIAADIDQCVINALLFQYCSGAIQSIAFGV